MLRKLTVLFFSLLIVTAVLLFGWYQVDGIPMAEASVFLESDEFSFTEEDDGSLLFTPTLSNGHGILIMHGALIKPRSYAKSAAFFTQQGYTVYLPYGPGRLSIAAVDSAAARIAQMAIDEWFFIGHSMGGMASMQLITSHDIDAQGVALWATAMPADFSDVDVPIMMIWGDHDGLLPAQRLQQGKQNLPLSVEYVTLEGANHKNFAMYTHQFFDNEATIGWMEQIDFANETTAEFFAQLQ
jgi:pimeloyl-ACP methyl ester carboxylesterase